MISLIPEVEFIYMSESKNHKALGYAIDINALNEVTRPDSEYDAWFEQDVGWTYHIRRIVIEID
ncbi:hypothetical protein LCGC14_0547950 [marine sediment metagenome]|uniref:Uncharacterized protein n=1 Tax=marine sediment metagenome TaxID=412755 RepID=A0A0F9UZ56_9ZZZZ